jgi:hypothetical protein
VFWYVSLDRPMRPVLLRYSAVQSDEKKKASRRRPRLLADVDLHVGAGPAGNYPLSKQIGEQTSLLSLRLCHVVHVRRKCYLPDTLILYGIYI